MKQLNKLLSALSAKPLMLLSLFALLPTLVSAQSSNIEFADDAVKALCVANWDTNGDGELSYAEAAAVTDLGNIFSDNQEIKKINELQYFTGLTSIGERAFDWCTGLTSVIIPNSVTNIGFGAFRDCSSLTSVTIPDNVSSIDTYAFMSCERLTSITIPNNVTSIGSEAFSGCSGLTSIKVESGNTKYDSRNNCNAIIETNTNILITGCMNTIIPNSVTTIGDFAFYYCSGLTSANIPNSVTSIGTRAFEGCTGLTSVTIPNSVTSIGMSAFQYCTGLTSVTIPNSVTSIGRSVFYWCTGLTEVISLIEEPWGIDESTFMCYDETGESYYPASTLYVPAGTKEKYEATAGWNKFKNIVEMEAPSGNIDFADPAVKALCVANWDTDGDGELSYAEAATVTDIGTGFANNKDITSFDELQYFTGVTELSEAAFAFSSNLQSIVIPKSVIRIDRLLLIKCENLKSIRVDEENSSYDSRDNCNAIIETASNRLISGCMNTVIPNSVESIGDCSFEGHSGLLSITIPNTVKAIEFGAFNSCSGLSSITIPKSVTYIGVSAFANCSGLKTIQVENGNPEYDSRNNCNAIISTNGNALIAGCMSTVIPNTVTSIESFAFCGCTGLTSLDIPNSVTSIGYLAFSDCSNMTSVTIPNSVVTIENAAFQNCSSITSLDFPNSVTTIGSSAFTCCTSLTSITIPESVANIGDGAFSCCESMEKVFSYIKEPFEIASDAFSTDWEKNTATLYVPVGCKEIYENTAGWNKFANIVEMGASSGIAIDATNFPDENFRNWVLAQDYGQDGVLTEEEIAGVKEIDVGYKSITDLKGIEYFTALTTLYCYDNQLTYLDVSKNTALTLLSCGENQLTFLDVSKNTALTLLACEKNQLTYLDVSKNTALTLLSCQENQINETEMGNLVESLPANNGSFYVKRLDVSNEQNIITTEQVEAAKAKGWRVCAFDDGVWTEYDGDASAGIPINSTTFPDENFRNWVLAQDYGQDGVLTETEIAGVKEIEVGSKSIIDLKGIEYFTALTYLDCSSNQLASLDVSKNKDLEALDCNNNQLTTLDMSNNTALTGLFFSCNQLTSLDVSKNTALKWLVCDNNQLTSLDLLKNTALVELYCYNNQINGASMDALIAGLPSTGGDFFAIAPVDSREQNVVTKAQVTAAKEKGWTTYYWNLETGKFEEYEGCDSEIAPVEQGETIDIGKEIDENTSLDGNVVGDVYYSISSGDGNYDAAEGCLVVTKPTDDSAIDGQDIFGEDFKDNYTGIVFKLAPGKGSIKVEAETQGNMVLKVKIGNSDPIEMELDGKLKVKFPYNVSEPTYVYIYGGMGAAGAKAMGANRAKSAADLLKIYGFEIVSDPSGIDAIENGKQADAPVYNLNGQRVNTPSKGVYIKNGRKVLVK